MRQVLRPYVDTALGSTESGDSDERPALPDGVTIRSVQPFFNDAVASSVPRGRIYAVCRAVNREDTSDVLAVLWRGYVHTGASMATSFPNASLPDGYRLQAVATQISRGVARRIAFKVVVDSDKEGAAAGGGYVHDEAPGDGPGETVSVAMTVPAVGQNFADVSVPTLERWRVKSWRGIIACDATVVDRYARLLLWTSGALKGMGVSQNPATATTGRNFTAQSGVDSGVPSGSTEQPYGISNVPLDANDFLDFYGVEGAGDQWTAGYLVTERWAMP